jgi:outer membrane protein assembly factor BamD
MRRWLIWAFCAMTATAWADLTYDVVKGWTSTDGSVEQALSKGLENPDALCLMNQAGAQYATHKAESARTTYRRVYQKYPASAWAPQALFEIARIRVEQKEPAKAFEAYGHIVSEYPSYTAFNKIIEEMFALADQMRDEKNANFLGWRYKDRQAVIDAFEKIVTAAPYSDYAPRALFTIGGLYGEKKEYLSAVDAYQRLIAGYAAHPLLKDAYWMMGESYQKMVAGAAYDQGATTKALQAYGEFVALFPDDARIPEAKARMGQMSETLALGKYNLALFYLNKRHNSAAAVTLLKDVLQVAPESSAAVNAQKLLESIAGGKPLPEVSKAEPSHVWKPLKKLLFWEK